MTDAQKKKITELLSARESNKEYDKNYWIPYEDYFDIQDNNIDFACETLGGIQVYKDVIEELSEADDKAKVYVDVYGIEDGIIYSETLVVYSGLSLDEVTKVFNKTPSVEPSDIGEYKIDTKRAFIINKNGQIESIEENGGLNVYYCWWD